MNGGSAADQRVNWLHEHLALIVSLAFFAFAVLRVWLFARRPELALEVARQIGPSQIAIGTAVVLMPLAFVLGGLWVSSERQLLGAVIILFGTFLTPFGTWPLIGALLIGRLLRRRLSDPRAAVVGPLVVAIGLSH